MILLNPRSISLPAGLERSIIPSSLPKNFSIQLSGEYNSKTVLPPGGSGSRGFGGGMMMFGPSSSSQGYVRANYFVDMGLRFEFP